RETAHDQAQAHDPAPPGRPRMEATNRVSRLAATAAPIVTATTRPIQPNPDEDSAYDITSPHPCAGRDLRRDPDPPETCVRTRGPRLVRANSGGRGNRCISLRPLESPRPRTGRAAHQADPQGMELAALCVRTGRRA